jgi:hypothetical protein
MVRRRFGREFKLEAVRLVRERGVSVAQAARAPSPVWLQLGVAFMSIGSDPQHFQLWDYSVSHGSLLVRCPRKQLSQENIDIQFFGVEYISMPRHLGDVGFVDAEQAEIETVEHQLGRKIIEPSRLWVLSNGSRRFLVVAAGAKTTRNHLDLFESPFS